LRVQAPNAAATEAWVVAIVAALDRGVRCSGFFMACVNVSHPDIDSVLSALRCSLGLDLGVCDGVKVFGLGLRFVLEEC
jgi:hypothetical protein